MGYMIQQSLANGLWESGMHSPVATVITQVIVDEEHAAFEEPSKPIGRFYPADAVEELERHGWTLREDPQGRGWRRVVASPPPLEIVEQPVIARLIDDGVIVIACGGGGIPVCSDAAGSLRSIEAVIDKDLASALLASSLDAHTLAILTEVDRIYLNFGEPSQEPLDLIDVDALEDLSSQGHFPPGSMGPKVEAVISFIRRGGERAIVTSPELLGHALDGRAGTQVVSARLRATAS
jgi:carbamate kinase